MTGFGLPGAGCSLQPDCVSGFHSELTPAVYPVMMSRRSIAMQLAALPVFMLFTPNIMLCFPHFLAKPVLLLLRRHINESVLNNTRPHIFGLKIYIFTLTAL